MFREITFAAMASLLLCNGMAWADETGEEKAERNWRSSIGLSFLATSGNSETETLGVEFTYERDPTPWGYSVRASYARAEENSVTTTERTFLGIRGERKLNERWNVFAGVNAERDRFAGFDSRLIVESGGEYKALLGPTHTLSFDAGLTWTSEDLGPESTDSVGGLFGLTYQWKISETASIKERLVYYPNFDESDDWRLTSETSLEASLTKRLAVKLGYLVRYDNLPVVGFDDTDTTAQVSLVVNL